jgi:hypothetical protein
MFAELAQYVVPKRKAIEVTGEGGGAVAFNVVRYAAEQGQDDGEPPAK